MKALKCSLNGCRKPTKDPSGRCEHHRDHRGRTRANPATPPRPVPASKPAEGTPAPSGYRDLFRTSFDVADEGLYLRTIDTPPGIEVFTSQRGEERAVLGTPTEQITYRSSSSLHREDGPARINRVTAIKDRVVGARFVESYYLHGRPARHDGGPTEIVRRGDGSVLREAWKNTEGYYHRENEPASIEYYPDGSVQRELYQRTGSDSRLEGPGSIEYGRDGKVTRALYVLGGRVAMNAEEHFEMAAKLSSATLRKHFAGTDFAELSRGREKEIVGIFAAGVRSVGGVREVLGGAPVEWVLAFEEGRS